MFEGVCKQKFEHQSSNSKFIHTFSNTRVRTQVRTQIFNLNVEHISSRVKFELEVRPLISNAEVRTHGSNMKLCMPKFGRRVRSQSSNTPALSRSLITSDPTQVSNADVRTPGSFAGGCLPLQSQSCTQYSIPKVRVQRFERRVRSQDCDCKFRTRCSHPNFDHRVRTRMFVTEALS